MQSVQSQNPEIDPTLLAEVESACARLKVHFLFPLTPCPPQFHKSTPSRVRWGWSGRTEKRVVIRLRLAARDGDRCFYCRELPGEGDQLTIDHLIPDVLVRTWNPQNLVLACEPCNTGKNDRIPSVLMPLLSALVLQLARLNAAPIERSLVPVGGATR